MPLSSFIEEVDASRLTLPYVFAECESASPAIRGGLGRATAYFNCSFILIINRHQYYQLIPVSSSCWTLATNVQSFMVKNAYSAENLKMFLCRWPLQ